MKQVESLHYAFASNNNQFQVHIYEEHNLEQDTRFYTLRKILHNSYQYGIESAAIQAAKNLVRQYEQSDLTGKNSSRIAQNWDEVLVNQLELF